MTSTSASLELQNAIIDELVGDAPLASYLQETPRVYDAVPPKEAMPYIVVDESTSKEMDTTPTEDSDGYGEEHRQAIRVWTDHEGKKQAKEIAALIIVALRDNTSMALTDHNLANIRFANAIYGKDADRQAFQGTIFFRAVTEET